MNWLDVIEDEANLALEGGEDIGEYMDKLRMARVIRELLKCFESFREVPGSESPIFSISALFEAYNNLPPDIKELLDEPTASSSN